MAVGGGYGGRTLEETPTWAVAAVCTVFVIISVLIEHGIHSLAKLFHKRRNKSMTEALEKIKAELMILGFISLLLTVGTGPVTKICIPFNLGHSMLPCDQDKDDRDDDGGDHKRKLLSYAQRALWRRALAEAGDKKKDDFCPKDQVSLMSYSGLHQLHLCLFVLAVFHILYSVIIMALAQAKIKKWKSWEAETDSLEYQFTNDPARFRFASQTSFVRRHGGFSRAPGIRWIVAFFRQFYGSVSKVDYMTMRHGFINAHLAPNSKFNFQKYIKRSMEDDFKVVVGISIPLWILGLILLLLNIYKWNTLSWISLVPLTILLLVGTKLELVIMEMAQRIEDRTTVVRGSPIVEPSNSLFWFNKPHWILILIHLTSFQNAFQMALFLWTLYEFGIDSCLHQNFYMGLGRVSLGVALQFLCSYVTFPLYALVTLMGSHMKQAIFEEQTAKALKKWQKAAKERSKQRKTGEVDNSSNYGFMMSAECTRSSGSSSLVDLLHNYGRRSDAPAELESVTNSPLSCRSDTDLRPSETEIFGHTRQVTTTQPNYPQSNVNIGAHSVEFSFVNPKT